MALNLSIMSYQLGLLSNLQRLKVCCTLVATQRVIYFGTQLMFWYFCTLEIYSLALNLSIMSYQLCLLSNPQRLKVCCTFVATQKVTYLGTQLMFWYFCTLEIYSLALNLSIMSYQLCLLSNSQRLRVLTNWGPDRSGSCLILIRQLINQAAT